MKQRLLYVDDDPDIRAIVGLSLDLDGGFDTVLADSGVAALTLIDDGATFDIIVLDVMMPGMDGLALLERLRDLVPRSTPILFMTAKGRQADVELYRDKGARGVIVKPFDPVRLGSDIRAYVDADG